MVHWIDHCVVGTNDVERWEEFFVSLFHGRVRDEPLEVRQRRGLFIDVGHAQVGGFIAGEPLPASPSPGLGRPCYGFYVARAELALLIDRLAALKAEYHPVAREVLYGQPGQVVHWKDPAGNHFDFWSPDVLPAGANAGNGSVGRISHAVFEARNLDRTAALFAAFCDLTPDVAASNNHRLVFRLQGGALLVFELVAQLSGRTAGYGLPDTHSALLVDADEFVKHYQRLWAGLPEVEHDIRSDGPISTPDQLPACTILHVSPAGRRCKAITGRGDDWFDWDTNLFHFYAGVPRNEEFTDYEAFPIDRFLSDLAR